MSIPEMEQNPCLSVSHVSKRFGEGCPYCLSEGAELERNICPHCHTVHAVRDVSMNLYPGEIVGIVGESGSGKSTFMQCLYFDQEATEGEVRALPFDGGKENLLTLSSQHKRKVRNTVLGMVYQNPYLGLRMDFSSMSNIAEQMIAAGNRNVGIPQRFSLAACSSVCRLQKHFPIILPSCCWTRLLLVLIFRFRRVF